MRRFWLFMGEDHYPKGGMEDFVTDGDLAAPLADLARQRFREGAPSPYRDEWAHILDTEAREVIETRHRSKKWRAYSLDSGEPTDSDVWDDDERDFDA